MTQEQIETCKEILKVLNDCEIKCKVSDIILHARRINLFADMIKKSQDVKTEVKSANKRKQ